MDKFKSIFLGLEIAYGQYQPGERGENGKQKGKAFICRGDVTDSLWSDHLEGKGPALGIIPITQNNDCRWGCIDIDEYNFNHLSLIQSIRKLNFPLIVCRSKSGGAHVFLFTKENIPASLMQSKLKQFAKILGYEGSEIFPKQTEILVERGDTGNFLNLPYYNNTKGLRYAIDDNGDALTLEQFYITYDKYSCTKGDVEAIRIAEQKREEAFPLGPPCLNKLASTGFGQGSRNNALFNIAVFYKQSQPDTWEDKIVEANLKHMDPPLSNNEVQQLIKSVNRKGYDKYRCKDAPINSVCQSGLCRTKRFGVGYGEEEMPVLGSLTKYTSNPPQWFLDVGEARIELKTEQLYSPNLFALACLDQANLIVPIPKPKDWKQHFLKPMMTNLQEVEPLESLDPTNELTGLLQDWTTNRQSARTMDDIFNKLPYTDDTREFTYFRMEDFYSFLKKNNWDMDKIKTGNLLKRLDDVFVEETRLRIKSQQPRVVKIKTMKKIEASVSKVQYQEEVF
ncbi:hypothetical protein [uncultured virus]|uniref:Uncharacterized protein n=1 Tax=uncultured virus TaxID=340016 RepID=A0A218MKL5_9VIRU|nr:hypothetical protein [uncultured virus]